MFYKHLLYIVAFVYQCNNCILMFILTARLHDFYVGSTNADPSVSPPVSTSSYDVCAFHAGAVGAGSTVELQL